MSESKWTTKWLLRHLMPVALPAAILVLLLAVSPACDSGGGRDKDDDPPTMLNLAHLDHLLEIVERGGVSYGIVHIYAEAPTYDWVHDDDEGASALDDVARAAVVYLRHFELTGNAASREKAEALLRFVMYMQTDDGRFYNFVWNRDLDVNTTHENSAADAFGFWAARGVWALGVCAKTLKQESPAFSEACERRARRSFPHIEAALERYGQTTSRGPRTYPLWLLEQYAADATSELLLGLVALRDAYPDPALNQMVDRLAEGIDVMQFGSLATYPYGAHASWLEVWHGWGNSQTQALAEVGRLEGAMHEAENFYPRLLVDGWLHSMPLDDPAGVRAFEQIAYAVRAVAVGLVRLFDVTGDERYGVLAGLAASWFTGNNVAGSVMYDAATGRGYDGIDGTLVNRNAGAESTIEANFTVMEIERHPLTHRWMHATAGDRVEKERGGKQYVYRTFASGSERVALVLNITDERLELLRGDAVAAFEND